MKQSDLPCISLIGLHCKRGTHFELLISKLHLYNSMILCVAGPNGSGKTTFIECLAGLLQPDTGAVNVAGHPARGALHTKKALIGYIPDDENWFVPELCASEYFDLLAQLYREAGVTSDMQAKITLLCESLSFTHLTMPLHSLSHGNKKKVQIIAGLMHSPKVIIVDEIRNGLDPLAIKAAETLIQQEAARGACIIAATHDLWWAERVASHVLLLVRGKPALYDATKNIMEKYGHIEAAFIEKAVP